MGGRSVTAGFGANQEPLADAHGSERSRDRKRAVAGYRKKPDGRRTSVRATVRAIAWLLLAAVSLAAATRYPVTGIVLSIDRPRRSFDASCAAIPGCMEAMAMPYSVLDDRELADLKPGTYVDFTLVVEKRRSYAEGIRIHRYESSEREPLLARRLQLLETPHATVKPGDDGCDFRANFGLADLGRVCLFQQESRRLEDAVLHAAPDVLADALLVYPLA